MRFPRVKLNLSNGLPLGLAALAVVSFLSAWAGLLPRRFVEDWYSRGAFPTISWLMAPLAGATGWSLMDLLLPSALAVAGYLLYRRRPIAVLGLVAALYLVFFWTWGVNYHRMPVEVKLDYQPDRVTDESVAAFVREAAEVLNRTYRAWTVYGEAVDEPALVDLADARIRSIVETVDGIAGDRWGGPVRVKTSHILNPFFRAGSVTGMFNPFGHEALVTGGLLRFERPMVMLHEIAHVRGYANEGEANFIALLAAVHSESVELRYSGWLTLWMYLQSPENDRLLEAGPRRDLDAIGQRIRDSRIQWVSRTQSRTLDVFLRANRVPGGIRSYARIVRLAVGTRHNWDQFQSR
jgi:hypothetical protein